MDLEQFVCKRCGNCCRWSGYVRIKADEIDLLANHFDLTVEEFIANYTRLTKDRASLSLNEREDGSCIFFSRIDNSCDINHIKPQQCKNFPLYWNFPGWEKSCVAGKSDEKSI